ncbi:iron-containing alcohol dehydrogenase [Vibrio artabrorum]|uniref:iron-containing alcohol dehydrogenase n=1 Tax=Vibrio artabrorum TaxID=446374 RepID=UPI00354D0525
MENFNYYNPVSVYFGQGEINNIGKLISKEIKSESNKHILLVSYRNHDFMIELLNKAKKLIEDEGVKVSTFYDIVANPMLTTIEKAVDICRNENISAIVPIGGGSVIDSAKVIAGGVDYQGDIWDMMSSEKALAPETALPIICVSTIPATGSEMNSFAVVTNDETKEKSDVSASCLYPKISILDPELTCTLPKYQTGCGIADAISHVLEVYLNTGHQMPLQRRIMHSVVQTLIEHSQPVLIDPMNIASRSEIQWSACVAWNGWTYAGVNFQAPMHMMAHPMSARHGVTHGASLSIIMPAFMKYTSKNNPEIYRDLGINMLGMSEVDANDLDKVIDNFEGLLISLGTPVRLSEVGINIGNIPELVQDCYNVAFNDEGILEGLVPLTKDDVTAIFKLAL